MEHRGSHSIGRTQDATITFRLLPSDKTKFRDVCRDNVTPPRYACANVLRLFIKAYNAEPQLMRSLIESYRRRHEF